MKLGENKLRMLIENGGISILRNGRIELVEKDFANSS